MGQAKDPIYHVEYDRISRAIEKALLEGMNASFLALSRLVRGKLSTAGSGRVYRIGKGKRKGRNLRARGMHRASAPGYPPAVDTGRLRASFITDQLGSWKYGFASITTNEGRVVLNYGSSVVYAPVLEYGSNRVAARPYLRPSMDVFEKNVEKIFAVAFERVFRNGGE
jgi:hypothetical protein